MSSQPGEVSLPWIRQKQVHPVVSGVSGLRVEIIDASQLCGEIADRWTAMRTFNLQLTSPYFDIEFTKAVARVRNDVEIAIVNNEIGEIICILPYQRVGIHHAEPIGGRLNDVHGIIADSNLDQVDIIAKVMNVARLSTFGFHAVLKGDPKLERFEFSQLDSHFIDLQAGWAKYEQWSRQHTKTLRRQGQKTRALEREVGPIRFEFDSQDADALENLIELKRAKYQRTHTFDILSVEWASNLLREISGIENENFQGLLSTMYAGDHLVAAHFGMMSNEVLHYWFPTFDPAFAKYSPGTELLMRVSRQASSVGINKVDLGYGDDAYKYKFCNGTESVSCGKVVFNRMAFRLAKHQYEIRQRLKDIPLKPFAKSVLRGVFPGFGQWNFK